VDEFLCPSCGKELPAALGQHSTDLVSGLITCPHCGAQVTLREETGESRSGDFEEAEAAPPGRTEGESSFAGSENFAELAEELREKDQ